MSETDSYTENITAILEELEVAKNEIIQLNQWKKQMLEIWKPIDDYVRPLTELGGSVSAKTLEILKQKTKHK